MFSKITFASILRYLVTIAIVIAAVFVGWRLWIHYENDPWTRDGRIKADIVQVAPDVTGQVININVIDNQKVNVGDVLFEIDRERFILAVRQAEAAERSARVNLAQAIREDKRNKRLKELVSTEEVEQTSTRVDEAEAALLEAIVKLDEAKLDLERSRVVAAVDGIVTNLILRAGSYVNKSQPVMALVDRNSYYAEGYFEETKLPNIDIGNRVKIKLMSSDQVIEGHVHSISRGIEDRERTTGEKLMQNVNPAFNWVRLVQRIPVRIQIDEFPENVDLVAGQTVTLEVLQEKSEYYKKEQEKLAAEEKAKLEADAAAAGEPPAEEQAAEEKAAEEQPAETEKQDAKPADNQNAKPADNQDAKPADSKKEEKAAEIKLETEKTVAPAEKQPAEAEKKDEKPAAEKQPVNEEKTATAEQPAKTEQPAK